jgi:hypothetical protein
MGKFIKTGGTSSQFLKADGSVDSNTYLTQVTSYKTATTATVTLNGYTLSYLTTRMLMLGGYCFGVEIYGQVPIACFPGGNNVVRSSAVFMTDSRLRPFTKVYLHAATRHSGGTSEARLLVLDGNGYLYSHGTNYIQFGTSSTNPTYYSSTMIKVGVTYFVYPFLVS